MKWIYEKKDDHAVIWRCFSGEERAELPQSLEGLPVTELAPYGFSEYMQKDIIIEGIRQKRFFCTQGDFNSQETALCGKRLRALSLPDTLQKVGAYAFYNCDRLESLSFPSGIQDWGTGAFTGCHHVRSLEVQMEHGRPSTLKEVLAELREELCLHYHEEQAYARLMFPEFYEEGVENTPARILETHVHGTGLYYRNCFQHREFDFQEYDSRFRYAKAQESEEFLLRLAEGRLRYPLRLGEREREAYEEYLFAHLNQAAADIIHREDMEGLRWLAGYVSKEVFPRKEILKRASKAGFTEGISYLMSLGKTLSKKDERTKRFEL